MICTVVAASAVEEAGVATAETSGWLGLLVAMNGVAEAEDTALSSAGAMRRRLLESRAAGLEGGWCLFFFAMTGWAVGNALLRLLLVAEEQQGKGRRVVA